MPAQDLAVRIGFPLWRVGVDGRVMDKFFENRKL
jgi:hypothetical protein